MKIKFIALLIVIMATNTFIGLSANAQTQTPQSCINGDEYIDAKKYKKAIKKLTACLRSGSLTKSRRAQSYFNRARAYTYLYDDETNRKKPNYNKIDEFIYQAFENVDKSIELDSTGNAMAYCLRGYILLEESWGWVGGEDIDKAIAMGASKDLCNFQ